MPASPAIEGDGGGGGGAEQAAQAAELVGSTDHDR